MKLVSTACPNCGAKLQLNTDLRQASCDYCGHSFLIDDEVKRVSLEVQNGQQLGRDLEIGRRSVRGANVELAREVYDLIEPLSTLTENQEKVARLERSLKTEESRASGAKIATIAVPAVLLFIYIGSYIQGNKSFEPSDLQVFIFFTAIPAFIWGYSVLNIRSRNKSIERAKEDLDNSIKALQGHDIEIIPPSYRHRQALTFFYDALYNQRAMTIQESVNLYDRWLRDNRMEAMQRAQLNAQINNRKR